MLDVLVPVSAHQKIKGVLSGFNTILNCHFTALFYCFYTDSGDQTSGKVATGAAPAAAKKKVPVPRAKRDKRAASTANKKAPVTNVKRAKGLASTSKKMVRFRDVEFHFWDFGFKSG